MAYVSISVRAKWLTEITDEHLSLMGTMNGANRAAIVATPQKEDCFPKSAFCTHTHWMHFPIAHLANRKESQTGLDAC